MDGCILCAANNPDRIHHPVMVLYRCSECSLIFKDRALFPSPEAERRRYELHHNSVADQGYVRFLQKVVDPALMYLRSDMEILDYGCGPGPSLSVMLQTLGFGCDNYDPYFFPEMYDSKYDFIFSTEVVEHFFSPDAEIKKVGALLKSGGYLAVMTEFYPMDITSWHYLKDITHVCFYNSATFDFIAEKFGFQILYSDNRRVVIMQKK